MGDDLCHRAALPVAIDIAALQIAADEDLAPVVEQRQEGLVLAKGDDGKIVDAGGDFGMIEGSLMLGF